MRAWITKLLIMLHMPLVIFCLSLSAEPIEANDTWAPRWSKDLINDCYSLSGVYSSIGEMLIRGETHTRPSRLEVSIFGIDNLDRPAQTVRLEQKAGSPLSVSLDDSKGKVILTRSYDAPYACESPWIVYVSNVEGSGDGSSVLSTKTTTKIASSSAHELVVLISTVTVSRDWFFSRKEDSTEAIHRFSGIR